jgi:SAM-dependent methyltransferase
MPSISAAEVAGLIACPRCHHAIHDPGDGLCCTSASCDLSAPGSFPVTGRLPVMIDFERSVVDRDALPSSGTGTSRWSLGRLPRALRPFVKPRNRVAEQNAERLLGLLEGRAPLILVIGGGVVGNGVEALYSDPRARVLGCDLYGSDLVQLIADAHRLPLADGSVDAVVIQAVLQQLIDPEQAVGEIHRVLRSDGFVYAETPFMQPVLGGPYDFVRYTSSGHRYLFRAFEEVAAGPVAGPGAQTLTSVDHLFRALLRSELAGRLARVAFFWLRYLDRLAPTRFAMDDASAYYFLGRRSAHEMTPREVIRYYAGAQARGL